MQASLPLPIFFFTLAASAPILLDGKQATAGDSSPPPWQGLASPLATLLATFYARNAVFEVLHLTMGARPSEGLLVGSVCYSSMC